MELGNSGKMFGVVRDVELALSGDYRGAREIHASIGRWSVMSVRHGLAALVEQGVAEKRADSGQRRNLYRRRGAAPTAAGLMARAGRWLSALRGSGAA